MIRFGQKIIGRNVQTSFIRFGHWPKRKKKCCFRPLAETETLLKTLKSLNKKIILRESSSLLMRVRVVGGVLAILAGVLLKLGGYGLVRVFPYLDTKAHDH
jgi:hypothetical protein